MAISIKKRGKWHIIEIDGAFVMRALHEIRTILEKVECENIDPKVAFNLKKTIYLDSSAITLMLNFQKRLKKNNGALVIYGANEDIQGIFSILNLSMSLPIYDTEIDFKKSI